MEPKAPLAKIACTGPSFFAEKRKQDYAQHYGYRIGLL